MKLTSHEHLVIEALVRQENAQDLTEFTQLTRLEMLDVITAVDSLVEKQILRGTSSYHKSEIGTIEYVFEDNDSTQTLYEQVIRAIKRRG